MTRETQSFGHRIFEVVIGLTLVPILVPLVVLLLVSFVLYRGALYLLLWLLWIPKGKDTLFVYSDSPVWRDYMLNEVLPLVENRATVLNWSQKRTWKKWTLATLAFNA